MGRRYTLLLRGRFEAPIRPILTLLSGFMQANVSKLTYMASTFGLDGRKSYKSINCPIPVIPVTIPVWNKTHRETHRYAVSGGIASPTRHQR